MSLQDRIFDIQHKLEGEPEAKDFDVIMEYIADIELEITLYKSFYNSAVELSTAIDNIRKTQVGG